MKKEISSQDYYDVIGGIVVGALMIVLTILPALFV